MNQARFIERLESRKASNLLYSKEGLKGLVTNCKHQDEYIVTWQECPPDEQYDESLYTRNERHVFVSVEDLLAFLAKSGLTCEAFVP